MSTPSLKRMGRYFLLASFSLFILSACGFHLKGMGTSDAFTFHQVKLEVEGTDAQVIEAVKRQLIAQKVRLVSSMEQADIVIHLGTSQLIRSVTSLTKRGTTASELLKFTQSFSAQKVSTGQTFVQGEASVYRDRSINDSTMLAGDRELSTLKAEMSYDVARQVLDRINRSRNKQLKLIDTPSLSPLQDQK